MILGFDETTFTDKCTLFEIRTRGNTSYLEESDDLELAKEVPHKFMMEIPDPERPHLDIDPLINGVPARQWNLLTKKEKHAIRMRYWRA